MFLPRVPFTTYVLYKFSIHALSDISTRVKKQGKVGFWYGRLSGEGTTELRGGTLNETGYPVHRLNRVLRNLFEKERPRRRSGYFSTDRTGKPPTLS